MTPEISLEDALLNVGFVRDVSEVASVLRKRHYGEPIVRRSPLPGRGTRAPKYTWRYLKRFPEESHSAVNEMLQQAHSWYPLKTPMLLMRHLPSANYALWIPSSRSGRRASAAEQPTVLRHYYSAHTAYRPSDGRLTLWAESEPRGQVAWEDLIAYQHILNQHFVIPYRFPDGTSCINPREVWASYRPPKDTHNHLRPDDCVPEFGDVTLAENPNYYTLTARSWMNKPPFELTGRWIDENPLEHLDSILAVTDRYCTYLQAKAQAAIDLIPPRQPAN